MERIINEATEKLKKGFEEFFSEEQPRGISEAEKLATDKNYDILKYRLLTGRIPSETDLKSTTDAEERRNRQTWLNRLP